MPRTEDSMYLETVRYTSLNNVGKAPANAGAIAEATLKTWHQVSARLSPVIGERGVDALWGRSLYLTSAAYPWLSNVWDNVDSATMLSGLKACIASRDPDAASGASHTLLANFVILLSNMIGEALVERLLGPMWAFSPSASEQERLQ
ncbi:hypothetical protein C6366_09655 [Desulfonatronum sp. SC1]|nr:hypothetical protein C6366_09655 [Desulfonatronum sp. SC1]